MTSVIKKIPSVIQQVTRKDEPKTKISEVSLQKIRWLIYLFTTFLFSVSVLFFIVGLLYLTIYFNPYTFTEFSTTICAALLITFGGLLFFVVCANLLFLRSDRLNLTIVTTIFAISLFAVLIGIGSWGIWTANNGSLRHWIRQNFIETIQFYDDAQPTNFATAKIDWLQSTFKCCGMENSQDWRVYYLYGRGSGQGANSNTLFQQHPNLPFFGTQLQLQKTSNVFSGFFANPFNAGINTANINQVPDSCCIHRYFNCGKEGNRVPNGGNMYGQNHKIYTQGCFSWYMPSIKRDYIFISGFSLGLSIIGVVISFAFIGLFFFLKKRLPYL